MTTALPSYTTSEDVTCRAREIDAVIPFKAASMPLGLSTSMSPIGHALRSAGNPSNGEMVVVSDTFPDGSKKVPYFDFIRVLLTKVLRCQSSDPENNDPLADFIRWYFITVNCDSNTSISRRVVMRCWLRAKVRRGLWSRNSIEQVVRVARPCCLLNRLWCAGAIGVPEVTPYRISPVRISRTVGGWIVMVDVLEPHRAHLNRPVRSAAIAL